MRGFGFDDRFCIPFTLATCLGLSALALDLPITTLEANEGLVPPAAAFYLLGQGGGILMVSLASLRICDLLIKCSCSFMSAHVTLGKTEDVLTNEDDLKGRYLRRSAVMAYMSLVPPHGLKLWADTR